MREGTDCGEEECKYECAEWQSEKAQVDKKYELLKNHLLVVEETTIDTVGQITNNMGHQSIISCLAFA